MNEIKYIHRPTDIPRLWRCVKICENKPVNHRKSHLFEWRQTIPTVAPRSRLVSGVWVPVAPGRWRPPRSSTLFWRLSALGRPPEVLWGEDPPPRRKREIPTLCQLHLKTPLKEQSKVTPIPTIQVCRWDWLYRYSPGAKICMGCNPVRISTKFWIYRDLLQKI